MSRKLRRVLVVGAGVSGLATAYALEQEARRAGRELEVLVIEAKSRVGGVVHTHHEAGFRVESAANGWLDNRPYVKGWIARLGLAGEQLLAKSSARRRYIVSGGRLVALPMTPKAFLWSPVLSPAGKLRLVMEACKIEAERAPTDESLAAFAERRFGAEASKLVVDAMAKGVYATDAEELSAGAAFPTLVGLAREHGSVLRGFAAEQFARRRCRRVLLARQGEPGPDLERATPRLVSLRGGMHTLPDALGAALGTPPMLNSAAIKVERAHRGMLVRLHNGKTIAAEHVVLAVPAHVAAPLLGGLDGHLGRLVAGIDYLPLTAVALGWREDAVPRPLDGFGFLVPKAERRPILGCVWESSVFEHRAPPGFVLVRCIVGGTGASGELARQGRAEVTSKVRQQLYELLGVRAKPELEHLVWHERALPHLRPGIGRLLGEIRDRAAQVRGVSLVGSAFGGVAIEDCIKTGIQQARAILFSA